MLISKKMAKLLNDQVVNEYYAHITYLAMSYKFEEMNLKGYAGWFFAQATEEMGIDHLSEVGLFRRHRLRV